MQSRSPMLSVSPSPMFIHFVASRRRPSRPPPRPTTTRAAFSTAKISTLSSSPRLFIFMRNTYSTRYPPGKDVYCEKTMTWDIPEAVECLHAAQNSKQVVQIGLQHESSGELADARSFYKSGMLGKVTMVESWMSRNTPHGRGQWYREIPVDCDHQHVNWDLFLINRPKMAFDANKYMNWRLFWEFSGGNVTENMVHQ